MLAHNQQQAFQYGAPNPYFAQQQYQQQQQQQQQQATPQQNYQQFQQQQTQQQQQYQQYQQQQMLAAAAAVVSMPPSAAASAATSLPQQQQQQQQQQPIFNNAPPANRSFSNNGQSLLRPAQQSMQSQQRVFDDLDSIDQLVTVVANEMGCSDFAEMFISKLKANCFHDIGELKHATAEEIKWMELPISFWMRIREKLGLPTSDMPPASYDENSFAVVSMQAMSQSSRGGQAHNVFDAARLGDDAAVVHFLSSGAKVTDVNELRWTPLHQAAFFGAKSTAELLLQFAADVNALDRSNSTPLHCAALGGNAEIVRLLLERGARTELLNTCQRTPLQVAECAHKVDAASVMRQFHIHGQSSQQQWIEGEY